MPNLDEEQMTWLYSVHKKLLERYELPCIRSADFNTEDVGDMFYNFSSFLEDLMAKIPATTARMLAMKLEVAEGFVDSVPIAASLSKDMKRLTADIR